MAGGYAYDSPASALDALLAAIEPVRTEAVSLGDAAEGFVEVPPRGAAGEPMRFYAWER